MQTTVEKLSESQKLAKKEEEEFCRLSPFVPEAVEANMMYICSTISWQATLAYADLHAARTTV